MSNLENLTVIIVTYRTNDDILDDCINSIDKNVKILIVENSNDINFKEKYEKKFSNVSVILSNKNLGYGGGNNFGLNKVKTNYALILNPDTVCEDNFFSNVNKYLSGNIDFTLIGTSYRNKTDFKPAGFFNKKDLKNAQFDKESNYFDPQSKPDNPKWDCVKVKYLFKSIKISRETLGQRCLERNDDCFPQCFKNMWRTASPVC